MLEIARNLREYFVTRKVCDRCNPRIRCSTWIFLLNATCSRGQCVVQRRTEFHKRISMYASCCEWSNTVWKSSSTVISRAIYPSLCLTIIALEKLVNQTYDIFTILYNNTINYNERRNKWLMLESIARVPFYTTAHRRVICHHSHSVYLVVVPW